MYELTPLHIRHTIYPVQLLMTAVRNKKRYLTDYSASLFVISMLVGYSSYAGRASTMLPRY